MNRWSFWAWYGPVLAGLLLIGCIAGYVYEKATALYRRWACRREMRYVKAQAGERLRAGQAVQWGADGKVYSARRAQLENAATAQDKAWRRIH